MIHVVPRDCVLLFGIATTKAEFFEDQGRSDRDFSRRFESMWLRYEREFVGVLRNVAPRLRSFAVAIKYAARLSDFEAAFDTFQVVTLFSHWDEDSVEFADGMKDWPLVLDAVPREFAGIVDLCVCHPGQLAAALRRERREALVRYTDTTATPAFWLYFYVALYSELKRNGGDYIQALESVLKAFKAKNEQSATKDKDYGFGGCLR
jgi:hypothetical protein